MKPKSIFFTPMIFIGAIAFLPAPLFAQINLSGDLAGFHDYTGQAVFIQAGDTLRITPYGTDLDFDSTGWLSIKAAAIHVSGVIDGRGRGYGGGGGGGGGTYGSVGYGGGENGPFQGALGADATSGAGGSGGDGGGKKGFTGQDGQSNKGGKGGQGAGLFGGWGGLGGEPNGDGYNGHRGGYGMFEVNGDTTTGFAVFIGSGGGGGGGGGGGYRTTSGGYGGAGGVEGGMGASNYQLASGGGGGGGGAGGGALSLHADQTIIVAGAILTDGAGAAELGGGYGAGGGILLRADTVKIEGLVQTLGGTSRTGGDVTNGGTVKLAYNVLTGDIPVNRAGRILKRGLSVEETRHGPAPTSALRLLCCAPNPGRTTVVIRYQLAGNGRVGIKIFDRAGKLVATVLEQDQAPGVHNLIWNGKDFPSGVYFCQVTAGGTTITRPITLVK